MTINEYGDMLPKTFEFGIEMYTSIVERLQFSEQNFS